MARCTNGSTALSSAGGFGSGSSILAGLLAVTARWCLNGERVACMEGWMDCRTCVRLFACNRNRAAAGLCTRSTPLTEKTEMPPDSASTVFSTSRSISCLQLVSHTRRRRRRYWDAVEIQGHIQKPGYSNSNKPKHKSTKQMRKGGDKNKAYSKRITS